MDRLQILETYMFEVLYC